METTEYTGFHGGYRRPMRASLAGCRRSRVAGRQSPSGWKPLMIWRDLRHEWNSCPSQNRLGSQFFRKVKSPSIELGLGCRTKEVAEGVEEVQIPRRPLGCARGRLSPRKRGCGRLDFITMTAPQARYLGCLKTKRSGRKEPVMWIIGCDNDKVEGLSGAAEQFAEKFGCTTFRSLRG